MRAVSLGITSAVIPSGYTACLTVRAAAVKGGGGDSDLFCRFKILTVKISLL